MSEHVEVPHEEVVDSKKKKKGLFAKAKDALLPDQEEQAAIISTFVRMGVLVWSGGILTLNYVAIPGVPQQKIDPTFIASVFTGGSPDAFTINGACSILMVCAGAA